MQFFRNSVLILAATFTASALAAPTIEEFFRDPDFTSMRLSPNGEYVAALVPINGRRNIAVMRIDDRKASPVTALKDNPVLGFFWATDDRLIYFIDSEGNESLGVYAVNRDGSKWRALVEPVYGVAVFPTSTTPLDRLEHDPDHILVTNNERNKLYADVYKLNIHNGRKTRVITNPGNVNGYIPDHNGVIRAAVAHAQPPEYLTNQILYRDGEDDEWRVVHEFHSFDEAGWYPAAFTPDNKRLYVRSAVGRDTYAVYEYDPQTGEMGEMIYGNDMVDVSGGPLVLSPKDNRLVAIDYEYERPERVWLDEEMASIQASIDAALTDTVNVVTTISEDEQRMLFFAYSDRDPGNYYLFDRETNRLEYFASRMSWLDPAVMATAQPIKFEARDGETIHGYLTLPPGSDGKNLPLIVHPHGGPYGVRDSWGFNREVQFLASRGYAVVQMNFRGSGGYGRRFQDIGYGKWGEEMQDDVSDSVTWAVGEGIADPSRVCIYGASYGGYATMAGITITPDLYQCAVNYVGVVDIPALYERYARQDRYFDTGGIRAWFARAIGDPEEDRNRLEYNSPLNHIEKIRVPVYVVHGKNDPRVDIDDHARRLIRELKKHKVEHHVLIKNNEGHGFRKAENNIELYTELEAFFGEHLSKRAGNEQARAMP